MKQNLLYPTTVSLETSNICNCKCAFCPLFNGDSPVNTRVRKPGFMAMDLFERLLEQIVCFPELPYVYLNMFGEPLLDKTLPQKMALLKEAKLSGRVYLQTNAEHLTEEMSEHILRAGIYRIVPCLESAEKGIAEAIRPGIVFEHVRDNIIRFAQLRDKMGAETAIAVQYVRTRLNMEDYKNVYALLQPHLKNQGDRLNVIQSHSWASRYLTKQDYILTCAGKARQQAECGQLDKFVIVLADGKVSPCCFDYNLELGDFGDASQEDLLAIWNGEAFTRLRETIRSGATLPKLCTQCVSLFSSQHPMEDIVLPNARQYHCADNTTIFFNQLHEEGHDRTN